VELSPKRYKILKALRTGSKRFSELMRASGISDVGLIKALKKLSEAGLIIKGEDGLYYITDKGINHLSRQEVVHIAQKLIEITGLKNAEKIIKEIYLALNITLLLSAWTLISSIYLTLVKNAKDRKELEIKIDGENWGTTVNSAYEFKFIQTLKKTLNEAYPQWRNRFQTITPLDLKSEDPFKPVSIVGGSISEEITRRYKMAEELMGKIDMEDTGIVRESMNKIFKAIIKRKEVIQKIARL